MRHRLCSQFLKNETKTATPTLNTTNAIDIIKDHRE